MSVLRAWVLAYPAALPLAHLATWTAGRAILGRWPRPSLDDPKDIGLAVDVLYNFTTLLLVVGLPLFGAGVCALLAAAWLDPQRRRSALLTAGVSAAFLAVAVLALRWDPWGTVAWFAD